MNSLFYRIVILIALVLIAQAANQNYSASAVKTSYLEAAAGLSATKTAARLQPSGHPIPGSFVSVLSNQPQAAVTNVNSAPPFYDLVGLPPPPASTEFDVWLNSLIQKRLSVVVGSGRRTTVYHFSTNGDDANDGSFASPKRTLTEAQRLLDEAPEDANLRLRFQRGQTWFTETGLFVDKRFVQVESYGLAKRKPVFNRFTLAYQGGWEEVPEAPGVYRRLEETPVAWLYDNAIGWTVPFFRASNIANLLLLPRECSGAFFYDAASTYLYVYLGGDDPNTAFLRGLPANDDIGCRLNKHGGRLDGIVFVGFGLNPANSSNQAAGIKLTAHGNQACVALNSESYYCSSHACHFNAGNINLSGGIATFYRCVAGFCQNNGTPGETIFNTYVYQGDQETIFSECEARYGTLPDDSWFLPGVREIRGTACFGHTAVGTGRLYISHQMKVTGGPFGCARGSRFADTPAAPNLAAVRAFVVEESQDQIRPGAQIDIGGGNMARVNCIYRCVLGNHNFRSWSNNLNSQAWVFNCHFDVDATALGAGYVGLYNSTGFHSMNVEHSDFVFRILTSQRVRFPDYRAANSVATSWRNCVFGLVGVPKSIDAGYGAPLLENNGYFGTNGKFGSDLLPIVIANSLELDANFIPEPGDASYAAGLASWFQVTTDRDGFLRNDPPSLGDQEHEPPID